MTTVQLLKTGIEKGDWGLICVAYGSLTGEKIAPPQVDAPDSGRARAALLEIAGIAQNVLGKATPQDGPEPDGEQPQDEQEEEEGEPVREKVTPDEIDSEPPPEALKTTLMPGITTAYGPMSRVTQSVTNDAERKRNAAVAKRKGTKQKRPPPTVHRAKCTVCERDFESLVPIPKSIGSLCPGCLKNRRRP